MMNVYLDNAATTPMLPEVLEVMTDTMRETHGNPSSIHQAGRKARTIVEDSRRRVAQHLNASTGEIFFTSSATESNNMALYCAARDLGIKRIITSPIEHPCVLNALKHVHKVLGTEVVKLSIDNKGTVDLDELRDTLASSSQKTLVTIMHGNNEIGTIQDIMAISNICDQAGALFHTDAVQTIGKLPLDLNDMKVTFLTASGHKIYGPKGIGMIYINSNYQCEAYIHGGGQERQMRSGTENIYGIAGFARALDWLVEHRDHHYQTLKSLKEHLIKGFDQSDKDIRYNGYTDDNGLANILSIHLPASDRTDLLTFNLDIHGICASAGSACSSGAIKKSTVMEAISLPDDRRPLRLSLSHHNTHEEMDYVIEKIITLV